MPRRLVDSFLYAYRGVCRLVATQRNARVHLFAAALVVALASLLGITTPEWAILVLAITLVFAAELMNTALEVLGDAVTTEHNPLVGAAKDLAAGAVLVVAAGSVVVGLLVLGPPLLRVLTR